MKHNKIFSSIRPDWKLAKLLLSLPLKNTYSLIGAVARVLGIWKASNWWTRLLVCKPPPAAPGVLRRRGSVMRTKPTTWRTAAEKSRGIWWGLGLGQTVVIRYCAGMFVEAMEGTDETIERAAHFSKLCLSACREGQLAALKLAPPIGCIFNRAPHG